MLILQNQTLWLISILGLLLISLTSQTWLHVLCFSFVTVTWAFNYYAKKVDTTLLPEESEHAKMIQEKFDSVGQQLSAILKEETEIIHENMERVKSILHESSHQIHDSFNIITTNINTQKENFQELNQILVNVDKNTYSCNCDNTKTDKKFSQLLENIDTFNQKNSHSSNSYLHTTERINNAINQSIQAIQFEDIVNQLSSCMQFRLDHINEIGDTIFPHSTAPHSIDYHLDYASKKLIALRSEFHKKRVGEEISQHSMKEGDIELF